jgi:hypothetical protein
VMPSLVMNSYNFQKPYLDREVLAFSFNNFLYLIS